MAHPETKDNILKLIADGKVGEYLQCRGGFGDSWKHYIFLKVNKTQLYVMDSGTWSSIPQRAAKGPLAVITKDYVELRPIPIDTNGNGWDKSQWNMWPIKGLLTVGDYESSGRKILPLRVRFKIFENFLYCTNGMFTAQAKMRIDWNGNFINQTKKNAKDNEKSLDRIKNRNNTQSRARYRDKKAERDFKKHKKDGTLDSWDVKEVLAIRNAQVRQMAIEEIGMDKVLEPYPTKVLDKRTVDGRPYELIEIELPDIAPVNTGNNWRNEHIPTTACYLKMTNPSTGEFHFEGVARSIDNSWDHIPEETVIGALAWRDGEVSNDRRYDEGLGQSKNNYDWKYTKPEVLT